MKIVFINSTCNGSTGHIVQDLAAELESQGNQCAIAYGRGKAPASFVSYRIASSLSMYVHGFFTRVFDTQCYHSKRDTKKLIKWLDSYKPDLIWLHNLHGYYLNIKILFEYLLKSGIKIKWTLHDCWSFTGHCAYFDFANCNKWKSGCYNCPSKKDYPSSLLFDHSKKNYQYKKQIFTMLPADQIELITPSRWLANLVIEDSFLSKYNVKVINNKINNLIFKPTPSDVLLKYNLSNKKVILGVASVWDRRKGLNDFIELSKILPQDFIIVLIGLNDRQIDSLPANIVGIKRTENQLELAEWYSAAYMFLNLTYEDNYPTTNLEAEACGTPVITYDTGGSKETLSGSKSVCFGKGDIKSVFHYLVNN